MDNIFENGSYDENEEFVITPKGIFLLALSDAGLIDDLYDRRANVAWKFFEISMAQHGYVEGQE